MVASVTAQTMGAAVEAKAFNVEIAVEEFLADEKKVSLELPSTLTSEQRKLAKRIAEKHPVLNSESYGFGAERRLYLFKTSEGKQVDPQKAGAAGCVSIKNTFIDTWIEEDQSDEPIVFRSMPAVKLPVQAVLSIPSKDTKVDLSPVPESPCLAGAISPSNAFGISVDGASPQKQAAATPTAAHKQEVQVRNTFVHYDETREEERVVQSMPDEGRFRQRILEEAAARGQAPPSWVASPGAEVEVTNAGHAADRTPVSSEQVAATSPEDSSPLPPGTDIMVQGLVRAPAFNGLVGKVQSFDQDTGRYSLLLQMREGGQQWAKVKRDNLRLPPFGM
jgi:hypothetical protein